LWLKGEAVLGGDHGGGGLRDALVYGMLHPAADGVNDPADDGVSIGDIVFRGKPDRGRRRDLIVPHVRDA
jgi:hypothetical protein